MAVIGRYLADVVKAWDQTLEGSNPSVFDFPALDFYGGREIDKSDMPVLAKCLQRIARTPGLVQDVSRDYLRKISGGDNVACNAGNIICMDETLREEEDYLPVLAHEFGHYFFGDQAKASEVGTYWLEYEKACAKARGDKSIDIAGRRYTLEELDHAIERSKEIGKRFPGFSLN